MLLLMTVEPGFGGQPFLDLVLPKLRRAAALIAARGGSVWLQVDGGVSEETIGRCAEAGADVFVAGSAVFGADDPARAVTGLAFAGRQQRAGPVAALNCHCRRGAAGENLASVLSIPANPFVVDGDRHDRETEGDSHG